MVNGRPFSKSLPFVLNPFNHFSVDDLLSMIDSDEVDPVEVRAKSKEVIELFNKEVRWRADAKQNLMPKLEEYNNQIKETIGLRLLRS